MNWNKINHLDCIKGLKKIESESVDCIILDPPYNIGKDFGNNKRRTDIQQYVKWSLEWIREAERILAPTGTMYIYGFSEILAHLSVNLELPHRWLIWHYTNKTVPRANFWQRSHESILCVWKDSKKRIFNRDAVRESYTKQFVDGYSKTKRTRPASKGRFSKGEKSPTTTYTVDDRGALPRDVIKVAALAGGAGIPERFVYCRDTKDLYTTKQAKKLGLKNTISHPTQKPLTLTAKLLDGCLDYTRDNRVVIPFAGTGSEAYVCQSKGVQWIAFEINGDFAHMASLLVTKGFPQAKKGGKNAN